MSEVGGENAEAFEGRDGYLFLSNDSNGLFDQHLGDTRLTPDWMAETAGLHIERHAYQHRRRGFYRHVIAPNKETVLEAYLPPELAYGLNGAPPVLEYLAQCPDVSEFTVFAPQVLKAFPAHTVMRRDDTHWTVFGAYKYMIPVFAALPGYESLVEAFDGPFKRKTRKRPGDLGSKIAGTPTYPDTLLLPLDNTSRVVFSASLSKRRRVDVFHNEGAPDARAVLVTHDSFGGPMKLILPSMFRRVAFVHTPDFDPSFTGMFEPDLYLNLQIERFFVRMPQNEADLIGQARKAARTFSIPFDDQLLSQALSWR